MSKQTIIHDGCSSYYNSYWQQVFYPLGLPRSKWFDYYCEHFKTYELNATFYRFPTLKSLQSWYAKAPKDFVFGVKAPKIITHIKKFVNCQQEINDFYSICNEGLRDKLGCILFQLPPSFDYTPQRLELIISYMNSEFNNVIEFRNQSWWTEQVYSALSEKGITFCNVSYPLLPEVLIKTKNIGYIRLHGKPDLFYSDYTEEQLQQLWTEVENSKFEQVFIYFNNTASKAGILNALTFRNIKSKNR